METERDLDTTVVKHMASLSRLSLSEEEVARFAREMGEILAYASNLPELHDHVDSFSMRLDDDSAVVRQDAYELLANAIALEDGYVKVPAILDKSES